MTKKMSNIVEWQIRNDDRYNGLRLTGNAKEIDVIEEFDFTDISFKKCQLDLPDILFKRCSFAYCDFSEISSTTLNKFRAKSCDFKYANFREVDLQDLVFDNCKFEGTDFSSSRFWAADTEDWDLRDARIDPVWKDLFDVLSLAIEEIPLLESAIADGKINGSIYEDTYGCGCLNGTLLKIAGHKSKERENSTIINLIFAQNEDRPIERFCMRIKPGDTPENSWRLKLISEKIQEFKASLVPAGN